LSLIILPGEATDLIFRGQRESALGDEIATTLTFARSWPLWAATYRGLTGKGSLVKSRILSPTTACISILSGFVTLELQTSIFWVLGVGNFGSLGLMNWPINSAAIPKSRDIHGLHLLTTGTDSSLSLELPTLSPYLPLPKIFRDRDKTGESHTGSEFHLRSCAWVYLTQPLSDDLARQARSETRG
jgi:hypothetical protein